MTARRAVWIAVICVIAAVALLAAFLIILTFVGSRMQNASRFAKETAALASIRTIHTAQVQYYSQYGRFATSLAELGPPASGAPSAAAADLIPADLAGGERHGYRFTMTGNRTRLSSARRNAQIVWSNASWPFSQKTWIQPTSRTAITSE